MKHPREPDRPPSMKDGFLNMVSFFRLANAAWASVYEALAYVPGSKGWLTAWIMGFVGLYAVFPLCVARWGPTSHDQMLNTMRIWNATCVMLFVHIVASCLNKTPRPSRDVGRSWFGEFEPHAVAVAACLGHSLCCTGVAVFFVGGYLCSQFELHIIEARYRRAVENMGDLAHEADRIKHYMNK